MLPKQTSCQGMLSCTINLQICFTCIQITFMTIAMQTRRKLCIHFNKVNTKMFFPVIRWIDELLLTPKITTFLQSWTKYLRKTLFFMWNSALPGKFNIYFSGVFCTSIEKKYFWRKTGDYSIILSSFEIYLIFPNFPRS